MNVTLRLTTQTLIRALRVALLEKAEAVARATPEPERKEDRDEPSR